MAPSVSERARQMPASPIRKLMPLADAAKRRGVHVYHLNIGQPDLETPAAMRAKLALAPSVLAYTPFGRDAGVPRTRSRSTTAGSGSTLGADELVVTTGGSEAILFALLACAGEGDEALVVEPFYTNYQAFATMAGVRLRAAALARARTASTCRRARRGSARSRRGRGSCCSATRTTRPAPSTRRDELETRGAGSAASTASS